MRPLSIRKVKEVKVFFCYVPVVNATTKNPTPIDNNDQVMIVFFQTFLVKAPVKMALIRNKSAKAAHILFNVYIIIMMIIVKNKNSTYFHKQVEKRIETAIFKMTVI